MISQKNMLIRHLIEKLDEFKVCNLTMNGTIIQLENQNWHLERTILKLKGFEQESVYSERCYKHSTKSFTPESYSEIDFDT